MKLDKLAVSASANIPFHQWQIEIIDPGASLCMFLNAITTTRGSDSEGRKGGKRGRSRLVNGSSALLDIRIDLILHTALRSETLREPMQKDRMLLGKHASKFVLRKTTPQWHHRFARSDILLHCCKERQAKECLNPQP